MPRLTFLKACLLGLIPFTGFGITHKIPKNFFRLEGDYIYYTKTHVHEPTVAQDEIKRTVTYHADISLNHMFNRKGGFKLGLGMQTLEFDWPQNPITTRDRFTQLQMSTGLFTLDAKGFMIVSELMLMMDPVKMDLEHYTLYRGLLYTKYNYKNKANIHAGFVGYYGLRYNRVVPIIGVDFPLGEYFKVNAVFPSDMSLEFNPTQLLTFLVRLRFVQLPRRLSENDPLSKGVIFYNNTGAEFGVKLHYLEYFYLQGFVGRTIEPHIKAESFSGDSTTYYRLRSNYYFGASLLMHF